MRLNWEGFLRCLSQQALSFQVVEASIKYVYQLSDGEAASRSYKLINAHCIKALGGKNKE